MDDWIDYYDSTHTIYASKLHRDLHFQIIAKDITSYVTSPNAVVLDMPAAKRCRQPGWRRLAASCFWRSRHRRARPADRAFCSEHENQGAIAG